VQNADSSSLFDDLDAALQSGSSQETSRALIAAVELVDLESSAPRRLRF
jgi:hypothetical protein